MNPRRAMCHSQFAESAKREQAITANLSGLGFEFKQHEGQT